MNAIQTFWAPPGLPADQISGGWLDPRFHFMSWALSASLLYEHFPHTVLHTDASGRRILVDALELPYDEVQLTQDGKSGLYPKTWWVLRKISSYAHADTPFLHVDGDAFLWNGLPQEFWEKPVIAQNDQSGFQCYDLAIKQLSEAGIPLPHFFGDAAGPHKAVNMGIVGGTNYLFFKDYVSEIEAFYHKYLSKTDLGTNYGFLNTLVEECFFRHYAEYCEQPVSELITSKLDQDYKSLANCMDESFGITHLIGSNKKDLYYCKQVEFQLRRRFPAMFQKVVRFIEGSWNDSTTFSFPTNDLFPESNLMASEIDPGQVIDIENCGGLEARYRQEGQENLSKIIGFERSKYDLFQNLISEHEELHQIQNERLVTLDQVLGQNLRLNPDSSLIVNNDIPVMSFLYPGKTHTYYLATVYDFAFGYRHVAHRPLDDLSIFVLLAAEDPITIASLIQLVIDKAPQYIGSDQHAWLLYKTDLKIKELLFLGLVEHVAESETGAFSDKAREAAS